VTLAQHHISFMKQKFNQYIAENHLFTEEDKLLVAVSGGVDSMVLCHLLHESGYSFDIAHCNFQLRGDESDGDEIFVENYANNIGVKCHKIRFDTEGVSKKEKTGIQETARSLRYDWFEKIRQQFNYQCIPTAHHASDNIETVLFNLSRGTGLQGLTGISPKNGFIVRPLLGFKKEDIILFSKAKRIDFREDSSNETDKYSRNFIRQHIIPDFKKVNPSFENTMIENIEHFKELGCLFDYFIKTIKENCLKFIDNQYLIDKKAINQYPSVSTILFEILKDFNFNNNQVKQILYDQSDKTKVGTKFYSATHELLIDRDFYVVKTFQKMGNAQNTEGVYFSIESDTDSVILPNAQVFLSYFNDKPIEIDSDKNTAYLDFNKLTFPLTLRHWQKGDTFQPLGMGGKRQKLSDFFTHLKLSTFEKNEIWLLETAEKQICWVVNYRIDERFKITNNTQRFVKIQYIENKKAQPSLRDYSL
jgi:tRNA(Ile)-lysidine synthase